MIGMIWRFTKWVFDPFFKSGSSQLSTPQQYAFRAKNNRAALVFVHGFTGEPRDTWAAFAQFVLAEPAVSTWDVRSLGFPSNLRVDVVNVWAGDPDLSVVARQVSTSLSLEPFRSYEAIALVAHSMGGLVVQRALLDDPALVSRVSHVFFYGTPSLGLPKTRRVKRIKRQFRDMSPDSSFIRNLRKDWNERFTQVPFIFRVVGGERDEFVPSSTSLKPFPAKFHEVVPGNHIEIVRPTGIQDQSVRIVVESLTGRHRNLPPVDSARLAVELGKFRKAVEILLPQRNALDDNAAISLALALESLDRAPEALEFLQSHYDGRKSSTDTMGTLAGRLKRRWLASGNAIDYQRALSLYDSGLHDAEAAGDSDQAFYHAINLAFLKLMHLRPYGAITDEVKEMARRAESHCIRCQVSQWRLATEGEALLILGDLPSGISKYLEAIAKASSQREIDSMYAQASRIAERVHGEEGLAKLQEAFGLRPNQAIGGAALT